MSYASSEDRFMEAILYGSVRIESNGNKTLHYSSPQEYSYGYSGYSSGYSGYSYSGSHNCKVGGYKPNASTSFNALKDFACFTSN